MTGARQVGHDLGWPDERRLLRLGALAAGLAILVLCVPPAGTRGAAGADPWDFDGDGWAELVVGVPSEDGATGVVHVLPGSASGPTARGDQYWSLGSPGVKGLPANSAWFGSTTASGDFDRDGYADLAIGVPGYNHASPTTTGAVSVLYGSSAGLTSDRDQLWSKVVLADPTLGRRFGAAIAAGDLDADGFADLVVGAPSGSVSVIFGGPGGLRTERSLTLLQEETAPDVRSVDRSGYGQAIALGDADGDGHVDIAIGIPHATVSEVQLAGAVNVVYGTQAGPDPGRTEVWSQDSPGILDEAEETWSDDSEGVAEEFGGVIAFGDFDGDGCDDLAVGVETERNNHRGAVNVIYGSPVGLTAEGNQLWHHESPGVPGTAYSGSRFGASLTSGDVTGDGRDELIVGAPGDQPRENSEIGGVFVISGGTDGLTGTGAKRFNQGTSGVPGAPEVGDRFGAGLRMANVGGSRLPDLAVAVPGEGLGSLHRAGYVNVLFAGSAGLSGTTAQGWSQNSRGVKGVAEANDEFSGQTPSWARS